MPTSATPAIEHPYLKEVGFFAPDQLTPNLREEVNQLLIASNMPGLEGVTDPLEHIADRLPTLHALGFGENGGVIAHLALQFAGGFGVFEPNEVERLLLPLAVVASPQRAGIISAMLATAIPLIRDNNEELISLVQRAGVSQDRALSALKRPIIIMDTRVEGLAKALFTALNTNGFSFTTDAVLRAIEPKNQILLERKGGAALLTFILGTTTQLVVEGESIATRADSKASYIVPSFEGIAAFLRGLQNYEGNTPYDNNDLIAKTGHKDATHQHLRQALTEDFLAGIEPQTYTETRVAAEKV